eukprot:657693-Hanusia_phi.AAC.5
MGPTFESLTYRSTVGRQLWIVLGITAACSRCDVSAAGSCRLMISGLARSLHETSFSPSHYLAPLRLKNKFLRLRGGEENSTEQINFDPTNETSLELAFNSAKDCDALEEMCEDSS